TDDRLAEPDADSGFNHMAAGFTNRQRDLVQRAPLPIGYGAVLIVLINARPGMRVRRDKHYVVDAVFPARALAHCVHLRLSERATKIECDDRHRVSAVVEQKRACVERIERASRRTGTIAVTPQLDARGRSDVNTRDARGQRLSVDRRRHRADENQQRKYLSHRLPHRSSKRLGAELTSYSFKSQ